MQVCFSFLTDSITNMKTPLEVLHKYFHHFNSERTRDLVVKAMEDYAKIYHDSEVKKLNIPDVINSVCEDCNGTGQTVL